MMKKNDWVSASDAGRAAFCPRYLNHKHNGTKVSQYATQARKKGDQEHDKLNQQAEDKRCYVATHLYGINAPETIRLRVFRDQHLVGNRPGRVLINVYYRLSPSLIDLARKYPLLDELLHWVVNGIVNRLKAKGHE